MFSFIRPKKTSRSVAKERLQLILAYERGNRDGDAISPDKLEKIKHEILEILQRNLGLDQTSLGVDLIQKDDRSILEIAFELPEKGEK